MHTRPIEADTAPEPRTDLDTTVANQTAEQAPRPLAQYGAAFLRALAQIAAISSGNHRPISVLRVTA